MAFAEVLQGNHWHQHQNYLAKLLVYNYQKNITCLEKNSQLINHSIGLDFINLDVFDNSVINYINNNQSITVICISICLKLLQKKRIFI